MSVFHQTSSEKENSRQTNLPPFREEIQKTAALLLAAYESVGPTGNLIYCSGAITTGRRGLWWWRKHSLSAGYFDDLRSELRGLYQKEVINENIRELQLYAATLRRNTGQLVIDPSALPIIENWTQTDWLLFWRNVIRRFASIVALAPDWEYSRGACCEFAFARQIGLPVWDCHGDSLDLATGMQIIRSAITDMKLAGVETKFFTNLLCDLDDTLQ